MRAILRFLARATGLIVLGIAAFMVANALNLSRFGWGIAFLVAFVLAVVVWFPLADALIRHPTTERRE